MTFSWLKKRQSRPNQTLDPEHLLLLALKRRSLKHVLQEALHLLSGVLQNGSQPCHLFLSMMKVRAQVLHQRHGQWKPA